MDLRSAEPFWLVDDGGRETHPCLDQNIETEVCIMGAGVTGALVAHVLCRAGMEVTVVDKRHPGFGSTAASTALLQYAIDKPLYRMREELGAWRAEESYRACYEAIDDLAGIVREAGLEVGFRKVPSLQYASSKKDVAGLRREHAARKRLGMAVEWLEPETLRALYGFDAPAAMLSRQGAQVDAFRLARSLLAIRRESLRVFDTVRVAKVEAGKTMVRLRTAAGREIRARHLVIACGYESRKFLPAGMVKLTSTYAFVSKPLPPALLPEERAMIWETRTPYLYLRTTEDDRIMAGGRDDEDPDPRKRNKRVEEKVRKLLRDIRRLRRDWDLHPDFAWAGTFGHTADQLPLVGPHPSMPNTSLVLGFGGNGIVFSQAGAAIVRDRILGQGNPRADLWSPSR